MTKTIDITEIKHKVIAKLKPSGWDKVLKSFIFSNDFDNIIKQLIKLSKDNNRFTPKLSQLFRAFEKCPFKELKVIMIGQDPYSQLNVADGIAFSCGNTLTQEPTLKFMLDAVNRTVYDGVGQSHNPDLSRWSEQGVLLLNASLTATIGKVGQHYPIWKPFLAYLFDYLTFAHTGLVYVYMGKQAEEWKDMVHDMNYKFSLSHPITAVYSEESEWDCKDIFNEVSTILKNNYNYSLIW